MTWTLHHPQAREDMLGLLPEIFSPEDSRPAREQAADRYRHGGGWNNFRGMTPIRDNRFLYYPGDPPMRLLASLTLPLTNETVRLYEHAWVSITQADGSVEISRMD